MVTMRAVDGAAVGSALQELEAGAGKALGRLAAAMPAATGLPHQRPATATGASAAPAYKVMPRSAAWTPRAATFSLSARGYAGSSGASRTAVAKTTSAKKSTSAKSTSTKSAASKELAFLDDPTLSIQDKLYQFMALQMKKSNQELKEAMQQYQGKRAQNVAQQKASTSGASAGSSPAPAKKSSGGGGLFGMLGDALGGIADAVVGGAESLAKDLGGPLLAAGVTAIGLPFLAPVALQIGGTIGKAAIGGVASLIGDTASSLWGGSSQGAEETAATSGSTSTAKASSSASKSATTAKTSSSSTASGSDDFDERVEAMNLQRLVEKQQAMFGILSNALKAMHDTQMNAIQNMR